MEENIRPTKLRQTRLDAWPVVSSALFELIPSSDAIISIVSRAGLSIDWNLNPKDNFSHSTRKRAYLPRIQKAYDELNSRDRETVLCVLVAEFAKRFPNQSEVIKRDLKRIGWVLKSLNEPAEKLDETYLPMKRIKELQKLLMLHVRDGKEPPELAKYSQQDQVYNAALLINDGYVEGQAIENGSGIYVSTVMTQLTSKGHDFLEEADSGVPPQLPGANSKSTKQIFISHSSVDEDLAEALVDMLCEALPLRRVDFLCTSVDGAKLRGGDDTDMILRREIREVPTFLSLLTPKALASTYVLFELGARWGNEKHHIPLLAKGAGPQVLKEPLKAKNALLISKLSDALQLVDDIAHALSLRQEPAASYLKKVHKVVEISSQTN